MELIQAEDRINTETAVQKAKMKRSTYVKTWRRCKKFEKRQALFVQEYVEEKYRAIYDEVMEFYNALNGLYPTKYDLRKTNEFRKWKKAISGPTAKKSQDNSGPSATNSQDNSGPSATNSHDNPESIATNSQDNSGPSATNSQDNSGPSATNNQDSQDNPESTATTSQVSVEVLPPLQVTDQYITQILQELRDDPDLNTIFNEIEIPADEDDDVFW